jgi:hypothetical protein
MKLSHGGARKGAGKKLKYGEETVNITIRVPKSLAKAIREMIKDFLKPFEVKKDKK